MTAGPHFNPEGMTHGGPGIEVRHHGDLGNVEAGADGKATYDRSDEKIMLYGPNSIIGRSMVCHAGTDDLGKGEGDKAEAVINFAGAGTKHLALAWAPLKKL